MSLLRKSTPGLAEWRPLFPNFFNSDDFFSDGLWKKMEVPAVNIAENEKAYEIEVAAPGLKKDDFKIAVEKGILTISAEKSEEKKEEKKNYTRQEYSYNSFSRSFSLPQDVKEDDIKAQYENGVLKLNVAKTAAEAKKAKEITIS